MVLLIWYSILGIKNVKLFFFFFLALIFFNQAYLFVLLKKKKKNTAFYVRLYIVSSE